MTDINHKVWLNSIIGNELSEPEARELLMISKRLEFKTGDSLFVEENPAEEFFLIVTGLVEIRKKGDGEKKTTLATLGPGSVVGEMSLLTQQKRGAQAYVSADATVLRVDWEDFQTLLKNDPKVAFRLLYAISRMLAARLKRINQKMAELATNPDGERDEGKIEEFANFKSKLFSDWSF